MLKEGPKLLHWNYFLALESDLDRLSRYVEFTKANFKTYSLEMALLLLAAGSEVDVVLKGLCGKINPSLAAENIDQYRKIITPQFEKLCKMKIHLPRFGLDIVPWDNWGNDKNPNWWRAYNNVKHHRDSYFSDANLLHTVAAISGLYAVVLYFYKKEAESGNLLPFPKLLAPQEDCIKGLTETNYGFTLAYRL